MTSWYDRVTELLGTPGGEVVALDPALAPEDVDLLLRAASDLLPPAEARPAEPEAPPPPSGPAEVVSLDAFRRRPSGRD